VTKVNWDLVDALPDVGTRTKAPIETFADETFEDNLWRFAELRANFHALNVIEGTIMVSGLFPTLSDGRLDSDAIIRVFDPLQEDGTDDGTDLGNVFKVSELLYNGDQNTTTIKLSNRDIHRASESGLDELRNIMDGLGTSQPDVDLSVVIRDSTPLVGGTEPVAFMGLFSSSTELNTLGYERQPCTRRVQTGSPTNYVSYIATWPEGVGTVFSDRHPIDEIKLFSVQSGGTKFTETTLTRDVRKFIDKRLHVVYYVRDP